MLSYLNALRFVPPSRDPATKLLVRGAGIQNSTAVYDFSPRRHAITVGGSWKMDAAQSKFSGFSMRGDGSTSFLALDGSSDFAFGKGDFTIEFWTRLNSTTGPFNFYDQRSGGADIAPTINFDPVGNGTSAVVYFVGGAAKITGSTALTSGVWYHIAVVRYNGSTNLYLNGLKEGSTLADANSYINPNGPYLMADSTTNGAASWLDGWMQEVLIATAARRRSNFNVPSQLYQ